MAVTTGTPKKVVAPVVKAAPTTNVTRHRRNTLTRKSLSKAAKRMFSGSSKGVFKMILSAEKTVFKAPVKFPPKVAA